MPQEFIVLYINVNTFVDDKDELSAPGTCHDTNRLEHTMKEIHRCEHCGKTLSVHCILD